MNFTVNENQEARYIHIVLYIVMYISLYLLYKPRNYVNVYVKNGLLFDAEIFSVCLRVEMTEMRMFLIGVYGVYIQVLMLSEETYDIPLNTLLNCDHCNVHAI